MPVPQKIDDKVLLRKHKAGWTCAELCAYFSCTKQAIHQRLARYGFKPNRPPKKVYLCPHCQCEVKKWSVACEPCLKIHKKRPESDEWILTEKAIPKIFEMRVAGTPIEEIAKKYKVKRITIYMVLMRRNWKHVEIADDLVQKAQNMRSKRRWAKRPARS